MARLLLQPSARSVGQLPVRGLTQPEQQLGKKRQCARFAGKKIEFCDHEPVSTDSHFLFAVCSLPLKKLHLRAGFFQMGSILSLLSSVWLLKVTF